jgi:hypothetical protein
MKEGDVVGHHCPQMLAHAPALLAVGAEHRVMKPASRTTPAGRSIPEHTCVPTRSASTVVSMHTNS